MHDAQSKLRDIAWAEVCPWLLLIRCVRIALMVRVLLLGAAGLVAVTAGWNVITHFFPHIDDPVLQEWRDTGCRWVWQSFSHFTISASETPDTAAELFVSARSGLFDAPLSLWKHMTRPFVDMFQKDVTVLGLACLFLCGFWEVIVWGLVGGAITRIAALNLTRRESPDIGQATRFAAGHLVSYASAPLMALVAASVFVLPLVVLGLCMRVDVLAMLAGIFWPVVLIFGLLITILLMGALIGWAFMWSTISVEGTDAFDAVSRAYAYTFQRPLRLLWYVAFAALLGALGMFVVKFFALATIALGDWSIHWGLDLARMRQLVVQPKAPGDAGPSGVLMVAAGAIRFWKSFLTSIAAGYQAGYLWAAAVGIYLLMRRDIDAAELDEVFIDDEEPDFGMPLLEDDESGVPEVVPVGTAHAGDE